MNEDDRPNRDILEATYRALCEHGYADLTVRDIAAESDRSKATIHYHYDSNRDLFAAFLEYLYEGYTDRIDSVSGETRREHLLSLVDAHLSDDEGPELDFRTALPEIKAQAPYDEAYRDRLSDFDRYLFDRFREVVAAGVEDGEFRDDVDPELAAEFLTTAIKGAHARGVVVDRPDDRIRETLVRYVAEHLAGDDAAEVTR